MRLKFHYASRKGALPQPRGRQMSQAYLLRRHGFASSGKPAPKTFAVLCTESKARIQMTLSQKQGFYQKKA